MMAGLCVGMTAAAQVPAKVLFLVAGQSNAVGMGDSTLSVLCKPGTAFEYRETTHSLVPLTDPVGENHLDFESARTGSAWPAFAQRFHELTGQPVVIVPAARGGSSGHAKAELNNYGTWAENGKLFTQAIAKTNRALALTGLPLEGIVWLQGERDANAINAGQLTEAEYQQSLEQVIERFRNAFGKQVPFFIVQTGFYRNHSRAGFEAVRRVQQRVADEETGICLAYDQTGDFEARGWMKDDIHYSQLGLNEIGKSVAESMVRLRRKQATGK
jgi:hypothetical protein